LSQFSRRAKWLNELFPPSVAPVVSDPTRRSDDVSLVQQYDGGALGISPATFPDDPSVLGIALEINEPEMGIREFLTVIGISTITDLLVLPDGLYARIFGATHFLVAGAAPSDVFFDVRPPTGTGVGNHIALFSHVMVGTTGRISTPLAQDIIPPGHQLNWQQINGSAATQYRLTLNWVVAPIGAIIISTRGQGQL